MRNQIIVVALVGIVFLVWAIWSFEHQQNAPCSSFVSYNTGDIPVRCLKELSK